MWACVAGSLFAACVMPHGGSNWELMRTAVVTTLAGNDPFLPSAVQQRMTEINLSFPYNYVWLAPIAVVLLLGRQQIVLFAVYLTGLYILPRRWADKPLTGALVLSLFCTLHSGNAAALEFLLFCGVFRFMDDEKPKHAATLLGVVATMKLLPVVFCLGFDEHKDKLRALFTFLAVVIAGALASPHFGATYLDCLLGTQGHASVTSEVLGTVGMDNQAVYQHGPLVVMAVSTLVVMAGLLLYFRVETQVERFALITLCVFLLWPRIPPHAYLAYAAVPVLSLYQRLSPSFKWAIVAVVAITGWLLVCRAAGAPVPATVQYWGALAVLSVFAVSELRVAVRLA